MGRSWGRALLVIAIVATTLQHAAAQFGGMPGMPGGPPGAVPSAPPQVPPPKCQALLAQRDEVQKHGQAIEIANKKRAEVKVACGLFRRYIMADSKMLKMLEADGAACGATLKVLQQVRENHAKAQRIGKMVCDAAARGRYPPSLDGFDTDDDIYRPFRLHPEPRPSPLPGAHTGSRINFR